MTNRELVFVQTSTVCETISIQNDEIFENEEAFYFAFSNAFSQERISVDTSRVLVTIQDDDGMRCLLIIAYMYASVGVFNSFLVLYWHQISCCLTMLYKCLFTAQRVVLSFDQSRYTVMEGGSVTACLLMTPERLGGNFSVSLRTRKPVELIQSNCACC